MKIAHVLYKNEELLCRVAENGLIPLGVSSMKEYLNDRTVVKEGEPISEKDVTFLPPISDPEKILCVGANYKKHILETNSPMPTRPVIFSKFSSSLSAHGAVVNPPQATQQLDYEAELVMIIGEDCKNVPKEEALSKLFAVTCGNDLSARDLQNSTSQWIIGKAAEGFAPIGPYAVTTDEIDPQHLNISSKKNGELRQSSNTSDMLFSCADIISYLSYIFTLKKGDLIFTGTPAGVIAGMPVEKQDWLQAGDVIEVTIEGIGTLKTVIGEKK